MKSKQTIGLIIAFAIAIAISFKIYAITDSAPEKVTDIVKHWAIAWAKGGFIAAIIGSVIFFINKHIRSERNMSIIGILIFTPALPALISLLFGYHQVTLWIGITAGFLIGYYCYIIDDHLLELWEVRHITLPLVLGLGFGGSVIIACIYENWQDENVYVNSHSTCTELTVERYTYHPKVGKNGSAYYSWDYHASYYYFEYGHQYKNPVEGIDYTLGYGALGLKDRASESHHDWLGCLAYKKTGPIQKWIYMSDSKLVYSENRWYEVEENFFGHAIVNGKPIDAIDRAPKFERIALPSDGEVPGVITMTISFFKIMFAHPDFALLRWVYVLMYLPFLVFIIFAAEYRMSFLIFLGASTIIILIIIAAVFARSNQRISRNSFKGFGGGSFSGGGSSSSW